ncbi:MAG TPA: sulfite exporter TauE/SafE family protein [Terriglobia bacterium]|nr:sulfite exporter TauE/SafE family protein [Terriglobia bacterium]
MSVWMAVAGVVVGILVGILSGIFGVGGAILAIPILVYGFKFDQKFAQGTSLAMLLPPTGTLAFWQYYKHGHADVKFGLMMAVGVFFGGYLGGRWAQALPVVSLRKGFAVFLVLVALKMFFQK